MMASTSVPTRQIVVVDDESDRLDQLVDALNQALNGAAEVVPWMPLTDQDPLQRFEELLTERVGLVATDEDLTKTGLGLLGSSITTWAQDRFVPVCNFSRQPRRRLQREVNFFELRVPREAGEQERAVRIARMFNGFEQLRDHFAAADDPGPTSALLAEAMGVPELQDDLAPFLTSAGSANSSFRQVLVQAPLEPSERSNFLAFLMGHILVNAVLRYPGPILSLPVLCAYCAVAPEAAPVLANLFESAAYTGPFTEPGYYFLQRLVDRKIDELADELDELSLEVDQYNRDAIEAAVGTQPRHDCPRCQGHHGGLWCPFTSHAVCGLSECSVSSSAWIPRGASLCRVEKNYFDEWSPLLGE